MGLVLALWVLYAVSAFFGFEESELVAQAIEQIACLAIEQIACLAIEQIACLAIEQIADRFVDLDFVREALAAVSHATLQSNATVRAV